MTERDAESIDPRLVEVHSCLVHDYCPLVDFDKWRVAAICASEHNSADAILQMERHNQTDEVFVLLRGEAVLFAGDGHSGCGVDAIQHAKMDALRAYNVRQGVWHACALGSDAVVLVVENRDTGEDNSDFVLLTAEQRKLIMGACS